MRFTEDVKAFAEAHTRRSTKAVSKSEPEESEEESEDEEENVVKGVKARKVCPVSSFKPHEVVDFYLGIGERQDTSLSCRSE